MRRGPAVFILICLLVASGYGAQRVLLEGVNRVTGFSPTHWKGTRPAAGPPPLAQRLVLVLADGLRTDDTRALPTLDWLAQQGARLDLTVPEPGYRIPGAATLLTGAPPQFHGVLLPPGDKPLSADTLVAAARRAKLQTAGVGAPDLGSLIRPDLDSWADAATPAELSDKVKPLLAGNGPRLVIIHTDFLAEEQHRLGTADRSSADYRNALAQFDFTLVRMLEQVDLKTTVFAVAGLVPTDAAGKYAPAEPTPMLLAGAGVKPGYRGSAALTDVAPTISALLGTPVPLADQGHAVVDSLTVDAGRPADVIAQRTMESRKAFADAALQALGSMETPPDAPATAAEAAAYEQTLDRQIQTASFASWRTWALGILPYAAGAGLLILIYLTVVWRQPFGGPVLLGTLVYVAAFQAIFLLTGGRYSAAMAGLENPGRSQVLGLGARAAAAMVVAVAITGYALSRKGFKKRAYVAGAACHLFLSTSLLIALPVATVAGRTGLSFPVALPGAGLLVWFFVTGLQVMVIGYLSPVWAILAVSSASISRRLWPLKEIGDPERNADKVVRLRALKQSAKRGSERMRTKNHGTD